MPIDAKWAWAALSISSAILIVLIGVELDIVRELVRIVHTEEKPGFIYQETEDAIKLSTLHTLTRGPNQHLSKTAQKIIARRASTGEPYKLLLRRLCSKNEEERLKALQALSFLAQSPFLQNLNKPQTFKALVEALTYFTPPHFEPPANSVRTAGERRAIWIMNVLIQYNVAEAISAGIVTRWLSKYCLGNSPEEAQETVAELLRPYARDTDLSGIFIAIKQDPEGRRQLKACGLMSAEAVSEAETDDEDEDEDNQLDTADELMFDAEETITSDRADSPEAPRRRVRAGAVVSRRRNSRVNDSVEEQTLRRRRREAMVLSDGIEPIGRNDIIQRTHSDLSTTLNYARSRRGSLEGVSGLGSAQAHATPARPQNSRRASTLEEDAEGNASRSHLSQPNGVSEAVPATSPAANATATVPRRRVSVQEESHHENVQEQTRLSVSDDIPRLTNGSSGTGL